MTDEGLQTLQQRLGHKFQAPELLRLALTHPSVAHEQDSPIQTNQRLEFLGDAVLQLVLTRELYQRFPACGEGPLTKARAKLVNRRSLSERAAALGLGQHLILSHGEEKSGGRERQGALADAFEAVLGSLYLDGGLDAAETFVLSQFTLDAATVPAIPVMDNPKGELQEFIQAISSESPKYTVVSATGPDHDRVFECTVEHEQRELARGVGKSKKEAESEAARAALTRLRAEHPVPAKPGPATVPNP
jgi:ribonuclease-3